MSTKTPSSPSDKELVTQAQEGSRQAFETLMQRHTNRAYSLGFRMTRNAADAHEIVQNTFLSVFKEVYLIFLRLFDKSFLARFISLFGTVKVILADIPSYDMF